MPQQHRYPGRGLHGELVHRIGVDIVSGRLPPGDVVPSTDGVDDSPASRTVFREVIKVLTAKGLVESKQRIGTRVRPRRYWNLLDPDVLAWQLESDSHLQSFSELAELRLLIEPAAARMAAERATRAELKKLRGAYEQMEKAATNKEFDDYLAADLEFHQTILAACHNELIEQLASILRNILRLSFMMSASVRVRVLVFHEEILKAIEGRHADEAEAAMRKLITSTDQMFGQEAPAVDGKRRRSASRQRRKPAVAPGS